MASAVGLCLVWNGKSSIIHWSYRAVHWSVLSHYEQSIDVVPLRELRGLCREPRKLHPHSKRERESNISIHSWLHQKQGRTHKVLTEPLLTAQHANWYYSHAKVVLMGVRRPLDGHIIFDKAKQFFCTLFNTLNVSNLGESNYTYGHLYKL